MRCGWTALPLMLLACTAVSAAEDGDDGRALLERRCGQCHAVEETAQSRLRKAPNLGTVLRSYPEDRLEFELAEGIGSRHAAMPQIQFTADEIALILSYLRQD